MLAGVDASRRSSYPIKCPSLTILLCKHSKLLERGEGLHQKLCLKARDIWFYCTQLWLFVNHIIYNTHIDYYCHLLRKKCNGTFYFEKNSLYNLYWIQILSSRFRATSDRSQNKEMLVVLRYILPSQRGHLVHSALMCRRQTGTMFYGSLYSYVVFGRGPKPYCVGLHMQWNTFAHASCPHGFPYWLQPGNCQLFGAMLTFGCRPTQPFRVIMFYWWLLSQHKYRPMDL